jgi:aminoglycoside 6'-N-acetyltransferase I
MHIIDLQPDNHDVIEQVAAMLLSGFRELAPDAWADLDAARAEVRESFAPDRISRVALDEQGQALGWIGGISQYDGNVWELHPLVVRPDRQRGGVGRALVIDLEAQVRERGGLTILLGSDDEANWTTLGGVDLYPDVLGQLAAIQNLRGHPFTFYQKLGFTIVGCVPDANGFGKPDIIMAKRVAR